jgi:hypothetical protein
MKRMLKKHLLIPTIKKLTVESLRFQKQNQWKNDLLETDLEEVSVETEADSVAVIEADGSVEKGSNSLFVLFFILFF